MKPFVIALLVLVVAAPSFAIAASDVDGYLPVSAPWLETFEAEVASFPMSKYFDQVDSMVQFLYLLDHRTRWTNGLSAVRDHQEQPF